MDKNRQDYLVRALTLQFVFSAIIFGFLFSVKYFNISFLTTLTESLKTEINKNVSTDEIKEAFKKLEEFAAEEIIAVDVVEEKISAEILGEGGADEKINENIKNNISFSKYKLNYKIYNPVINGDVSSSFGERVHPITGGYGFHKGIDLALNSGENIYAIHDGVVIESKYDQWNGNYIKIKHDNDIVSVYCHCSKRFVEKGTVVRGGEVIALVGSTGQSTGPHLHFEIRINNVSYNPAYALKDAKNAI